MWWLRVAECLFCFVREACGGVGVGSQLVRVRKHVELLLLAISMTLAGFQAYSTVLDFISMHLLLRCPSHGPNLPTPKTPLVTVCTAVYRESQPRTRNV